MTDRIVNEVHVVRREDGISVTYCFEGGGAEERYYSIPEAMNILHQLNRQLEYPFNGND